VGVLLVVVVLAGCEMQGENPKMDHQQAWDELDGLFQQAQTIVGGEWENIDGGARKCGLPSGGSGAQYPFGRFGSGVPVEQQQAVIDEVVRVWSEAGFEPTVIVKPEVKGIVVTEVRYPASGYGVDGLAMQFWVATSATTLDGQTRCVPGDADEINREWQQLHGN
jgi:hypothetical protein